MLSTAPVVFLVVSVCLIVSLFYINLIYFYCTIKSLKIQFFGFGLRAAIVECWVKTHIKEIELEHYLVVLVFLIFFKLALFNDFILVLWRYPRLMGEMLTKALRQRGLQS
jgi:hypothetical protein